MAHHSKNEIARIVVEVLRTELLIPAERIRMDAELIRDLGADGDDLGMLFVPEVEARLGIRVPLRAWEAAYTVGDVVDLLTRYQKPQGH